MKKRSKVLAVLLCMAMVLPVGCGGKSDEDGVGKADSATEESVGEEQQEEEPEEEVDEKLVWIQEACEEYKAEEVREEALSATYTRQDGSTDDQQTFTVIDTGRQIVMEKYVTEEYTDVIFYAKEGDNEYMYTTGYSQDGTEVTLKVLVDEDAYRVYSDRVKEDSSKPFETNESIEYSDVKVTEEGEEEIDGVSVVKLRVDYTSKFLWGDEISRESVLADREWTEEDIAMIEGMSDALDAYVEVSNAQTEEQKDKVEAGTAIYYLTTEDHKLVRSESEDEIEKTDPALTEFWDFSMKLQWLKGFLEDGMSLEEAKAFVNESFAAGGDTNPSVSQMSVTTYLTGDACETIPELPADAKEITQKQYEKGEY